MRLVDSIDDDLALPEIQELNDPSNYELWTIMHATNWVWPLDVVLEQDDAIMNDLMKIETWYQTIRTEKEKEKREER